MTLRHLKIFSAVCRLESITLAAEEMNMAQPAVSYAIRELEGYYETKLFERMNNACISRRQESSFEFMQTLFWRSLMRQGTFCGIFRR